MVPRRWISIKECQGIFGFKNVGTVYALVASKKIPSARLGRTIRIDLKKLEDQLESQGKAR